MGKLNSKGRNHNVMQNILDEINDQMFPGGSEDELQQVSDLFKLLGGHYTLGSINETLRFILSQMLLHDDKKVDEVAESVQKRQSNPFTEADVRTIIDFAIACNKSLSMRYGYNIKNK